MLFTVRIIVAPDIQRLRHIVHAVPEEIINLVSNPATLCRIHKEGFTAGHICAVFHHLPCELFIKPPAIRSGKIHLCGITRCNSHAVFIKPYGHTLTIKSKSLPGSANLIFDEFRHFSGILACPVFRIDPLSGILHASAGAHDIKELLIL